MVFFVSTRGNAGRRSFEEVLLAGLAEDGGLFVPENWPQVDMHSLCGLNYAQTTARILEPFTQGCFSNSELEEMCNQAYAGFDHPAVAPLRQLSHDHWLLELFHGPTLAFKDFALQLLGRMFEQRAGAPWPEDDHSWRHFRRHRFGGHSCMRPDAKISRSRSCTPKAVFPMSKGGK